MKININEEVDMTKLTEKGVRIYDEWLNNKVELLKNHYPDLEVKLTCLKKDSEPLWQVMNIFGKFLTITSSPLFENNILIFKNVKEETFYAVYRKYKHLNNRYYATNPALMTIKSSHALVFKSLIETLRFIDENDIHDVCGIEEIKDLVKFREKQTNEIPSCEI